MTHLCRTGLILCFTVLAVGLLPVLLLGSRTASAQDSGQDLNQKTNYFSSPEARQAELDWTLNCRGCHKTDATGRPEKGLPNLNGEVAKFLSVPGGREYLSRVPGVTNAAIDDASLTRLLNWMLRRFDPQDIPKDFKPYSLEEVRQWRAHPLALDAAKKRKHLLAELAKNKNQKED